MLPELLALSIPIVAIISFSPIGKAIAQAILFSSGALSSQGSNSKIIELEKRISDNEEELNKLREIVVFNDRKIISNSNVMHDNSDMLQNKSKFNLEKNI